MSEQSGFTPSEWRTMKRTVAGFAPGELTCADCGRQTDRLVMVDWHGERERFVCVDCNLEDALDKYNAAQKQGSQCRKCGYVDTGDAPAETAP